MSEFIPTGPERVVLRTPASNPNEVKVAVFTEKREGRATRHSAYTRDYNPEWEGCCEHTVEAGKDAKKRAIEQHKAECEHACGGVEGHAPSLIRPTSGL